MARASLNLASKGALDRSYAPALNEASRGLLRPDGPPPDPDPDPEPGAGEWYITARRRGSR